MKPGHFHYVVPATSSNKNLCRLVLSGVVTRFPPPVFINWGTQEDPDPYKVHMGKVNGILDYLNAVSTPENQHDLVLILDGYDIWLQLPPEIFIQRYYAIIDAENKRLEKRMGKQKMMERDFRQSVLFGPDKMCWPEDQTRPACWAVSESSLPRWAFGPETDSGKWRHHNRPKWLNSGTIMGPIGDVRKVFEATAERIKSDYTVDSDQFYFAEIFGVQEYARREAAGELPANFTQDLWITEDDEGKGHISRKTLSKPGYSDGQTTEYHIAIDYASDLFQTVAYYDTFLTWKHLDPPPAPGFFSRFHSSSEPNPQDDYNKSLESSNYRSNFKGVKGSETTMLPTDLVNARPPWGHTEFEDGSASISALRPDRDWSDLLLGVNTVSHRVWGLIHFTPPKHWIDLWWYRMWYAPYAEAAIRHATISLNESYTTTKKDSVEWFPYVPERALGLQGGVESGGGFSATSGEWLAWNVLCDEHEDAVFRNSQFKPPPP